METEDALSMVRYCARHGEEHAHIGRDVTELVRWLIYEANLDEANDAGWVAQGKTLDALRAIDGG